jgi:hypothetical protein
MNPNNYGTREAAQRLHDSGIVLETELIWHREFPDGDIGLELRGHYYQYHEYYPAPSMAEVWRELPQSIIYAKDYYYFTMVSSSYGGPQRFGYASLRKIVWCKYYKNTNPTDALIDLLIWLKAQKEGYETNARQAG